MLKKDIRRANGMNFELVKDPLFKGDPEARIKTELCRNWESGTCEYGDKCNFAHGQHELRDKFGVKMMKEKCEQFFKSGYCISGSKCLFSHQDDTSLASRKKSPQPNQQDKIFQLNPPVFIDLEIRNP